MKHQCYGEKEEEIDYIFNLIINRDELFTLYNTCKNYKTDNFIQYYKKTIINKYTDTS